MRNRNGIGWLTGWALPMLLLGLGWVLGGPLRAADILAAAAAGDAAQIREALKADPKAVDARDAEGNHALILAAKVGSAEAVAALLAAKAPVNRANLANETALWTAVNTKHGALAEALIAGGARVDCLSGDGTTPLHVAIQQGDLPLVKLLVGKGANVNYITRIPILGGDEAEVQQIRCVSGLILAAGNDQAEIVELLLTHHADPAVAGAMVGPGMRFGGQTALHAAAGKPAALRVLLKHTREINGTNDDGDTPLHLAVQAGAVECVTLLVEAGADMSKPNGEDLEPLDLCPEAQQAVVKALFVKHGYKPNAHGNAARLLKMLATAQAQYIKRMDSYAYSGKLLNSTGALIPKGFADAFEGWQGNGDSTKPVAYKGYIFRMLQGDEPNDLISYWKDIEDGTAGMNTWACIARPADGQGDQYYISEAGTVYHKPDTGKGKFMLDWTPPQSQTEWPPVRSAQLVQVEE